ncbi:MAG TPA: hypothetical protein VGK73_11645 [Polyangiaceae bacterium]
MKIQEVEQKLIAIASAAMAGDDEKAHALEDALFVEVLQAIAKGSRNGKALAETALKSNALSFERWCA